MRIRGYHGRQTPSALRGCSFQKVKTYPKIVSRTARTRLRESLEGINVISEDPLAGEAFRFTNEAMYQSISHTKWAKTNREKILRKEKITEDNPDSSADPKWRIFQLAFLLLTLESVANTSSVHRNTAELVVVSHRRRKDRSVLWHHHVYHGIQATEGQRYQDHRGGAGQVRRVSYNEIHVPAAHTAAVSARRSTILCLRVHKTEEPPEHQKVWQPAVSCRDYGQARKRLRTLLQRQKR